MIFRLIKLGYERPLTEDDLYTLQTSNQSKSVIPVFEANWQKELMKLKSRQEQQQNRFVYQFCLATCKRFHVRIQRGGDRGSGPPEKSQNIGLLSITGWSGSPDKLQSYQVSIQSWAIIGPPGKRRFAGRPMMARFLCFLDPLSPNLLKNNKKNPNNNVASDKIFWICA